MVSGGQGFPRAASWLGHHILEKWLKTETYYYWFIIKGTTQEQPNERDAQGRVLWVDRGWHGASVTSPGMPPSQHLCVFTNQEAREVVFNLFWVMGHFGNLNFCFTSYPHMVIRTCAHICTYKFVEFLELLKTYPKRPWTPGEELHFCRLVLSLKLCHVRVPEVRTDSCQLKY